MYQYNLHQHISEQCEKNGLQAGAKDHIFFTRLIANAAAIKHLYDEIYAAHPAGQAGFDQLIQTLIDAHKKRSAALQQRDHNKEARGNWFLSNEIAGMSLYVDRFCGGLQQLPGKLDYLKELGVNFLHLMPVFQSPEGESDGGYAVSDFRKVDTRFGTLDDLKKVQQQMMQDDMYLMIDIVLNHTSHHHEWAKKAMKGNKEYQAYYYMYDDRTLPDQFDATMPEIFPESSPGSFSYVKECDKWVMSVFHHYQWDLNYTNPVVFNAMLDNIFFYANLGIDILRIDAPAFIWKQLGTTCQNLPQAHTLLRLIRQCVQVSAPGMALLGEAIVSPKEIMKYFGTDLYTGKECEVAYNATQMALQWDALATDDTRVMLSAQHDLLQKPYGCTWLTYTRCHDDIGLGYEDASILAAGFNAYEHRKFLKEYYSGTHPYSPAKGALFSVNPKTQDARISGSLASLCGLETALAAKDEYAIHTAINRILLMQAQSFFLGGIPMLFYGDEAGYTNDYTYLDDAGKSYDNRWMHRPLISWEKNAKVKEAGSIEQRIYTGTQKLLQLRRSLPVVADKKNISWLTPHNIHVAGFLRSDATTKLYCLFNYSSKTSFVTWYAFREHGASPAQLLDHWSGRKIDIGPDNEYLVIDPYGFYLLEVIQ